MNKIILAADNYDLFNNSIETPEMEIKTESPVSPPSQASNSELSFVAGKMATSFGAMILSIILLFIILLLVKKIKEKNRTIQSYVNRQVKVQSNRPKVTKNKEKQTLESPVSVKEAINIFLNRTL